LYFSGSISDSHRFWSKWILGSIGVSIRLDPNVTVSSNKSVSYFLWDKKDLSKSEQPRSLENTSREQGLSYENEISNKISIE